MGTPALEDDVVVRVAAVPAAATIAAGPGAPLNLLKGLPSRWRKRF